MSLSNTLSYYVGTTKVRSLVVSGINVLSIPAWLSINGDLATSSDGVRSIVNSKGNDIVSTTGQMLEYNAIDDYVCSEVFPTSSQYQTVGATIKDVDISVKAYITGAGYSITSQSNLSILGYLGKIRAFIEQGGVDYIVEYEPDSAIDTATYRATLDGDIGEIKLFRNGLLVASQIFSDLTLADIVPKSGYPYMVGAAGTADSQRDFGNGKISNIIHRNCCLSESQIMIEALEPEIELQKILFPEKYVNKYIEEVNIPEYDSANASHVLITVADGNMTDAVLNDVTKQHFFIEAGDYLATTITLTTSGMQGNPRTFSLYNTNDLHPSKMLDSEQASVNITFDGATYCVIDRLSNIGDTGNYSFSLINGASNNIINRLHMKNFYAGIEFVGDNISNNTIQNSYLNHMTHQGRFDDKVGIVLSPAFVTNAKQQNNKIINNDIRNCGDGLQLAHNHAEFPDFAGTIIDGNRIWVDKDIYTNGDYSTNGYNSLGEYMIAENAMDIKAGSDDENNPIIITNNVMYGYREVDTTVDGLLSTGAGTAFVAHLGSKNAVFEGNIIYDSQAGFFTSNPYYDGVTWGIKGWSIKRNIFANLNLVNPLDRETYVNYFAYTQDTEIEENLFVNIADNSTSGAYSIRLENHQGGTTFKNNASIKIHNTSRPYHHDDPALNDLVPIIDIDNNYYYESVEQMDAPNTHSYALATDAGMESTYFDKKRYEYVNSEAVEMAKITTNSPHFTDIGIFEDKYQIQFEAFIPSNEMIGSAKIYTQNETRDVVANFIDIEASRVSSKGVSVGIQNIKINNNMTIADTMHFDSLQADQIITSELVAPYTIIEVADGIHYAYVNDGTSITLYTDLVASVGGAISGDIVLNNISQISGANVSERKVFQIYKIAMSRAQVIQNYEQLI